MIPKESDCGKEPGAIDPVTGSQADKPDADALPNISGGSLFFLASNGAPLGKRLPHPASARPYVITNGDSRGWAPARCLL